MQYSCTSCRRQFEFNDIIAFCPYCGKSLDVSDSNATNLLNTNEVIDSIWGETAKIKTEFSSIISDCIVLINSYAEASITKAIPKQDLCKYSKNYEMIKQSNNRKTLLNRVEIFVDSLGNAIDSLDDQVPADTSTKLETAIEETNSMIKELHDFLQVKYLEVNVDFFLEKNYSAEVVYTKNQLRDLYNFVLVAFEKYKRCVNDNNMFAAFSSDSNYGVMTDYWDSWFSSLSSDIDVKKIKKDEEEKVPAMEKVIDYMLAHNEQKYVGMLDEDFVPHVDAFWHGLKELCEFIETHISVTCNTSCFYINSDAKNKLMRVISSREFIINDSRVDAAGELKDHFQSKIDTIK